MENRRKKSSSGDTFSFPSTPVHEQDSEDFEFGCFTPDSASSDPCKDSPADHLFFNGKLLPHAFPFQPSNNVNGMLLVLDHSRRTSRTSSISSKDSISLSLMSSRSNSTNSRSSTSSCGSSARTSSSDNSERRSMHHHYHHSRTTPFRSSDRYRGGAQVYGSSQRWQFITPVPSSLSRDTSVKKKLENASVGKGKPNKANVKKKKRKVKTVVVRRWRLCGRFFRWLVSTCIKCHHCHAMEPTKKSHLVVDHVKDANHLKLR